MGGVAVKSFGYGMMIVASLWVGDAIAQQKDCIQGPAIVQIGYDDSPSPMQVRSGKSCKRHLDYPQFDMQRFEIVEKPRHGVITHEGRGHWTYTANKGFEGRDSFKVRYVGEEYNWRSGQKIGPASIGQKFDVTIFR
jgi:Bacterial Ig domain